MTTSNRNARRVWRSLMLVPLLLVGQNCTDLSETPRDALTPETAFKTDAEVLAGVAAVYAQLRPVEWVGYITLEDLTADVSIVPTRGSDWYDNGQWLDLHRQTFTSNSSGTLAFLNGAWNDIFSGIAKANLMIDVITKNNPTNAAQYLAELKTLCAWEYYMLQNMFGGVPLVTGTEAKRYPRVTRDSVFKFIESELISAAAALPASWPASGYGRMTKGAANAILASLYLNAGVFKKNGTGEASLGINATGYNSCAGVTVTGGDACTAAINAANAVIAGPYSLSTAGNWKENFSLANQASPENIFVLVLTSEGTAGIGETWPMRTLHYNQLNTGWGSPWNGFATIAETYNAFDNADERKGMWLAGQAKSFETGANVNDRTGNPLIFTVNIPDANQANEAHGVRFNKFPPLPSAPTGSGMPNDFPFFRLSEMYLIRAEAQNELGQTANALASLNAVHNLRNPTNPVTAATQAQIRDAILKERLLEFAGEGKRRTDMIRHGKFTTWTEASLNGVCGPTGVCGAARNSRIVLYPVPVPQLGSNPLLTQNAGY